MSEPTAALLRRIVADNRADGSRGIYSVCSAHRLVIEAAMFQAKADQSPLLIEATCNQVNHQGGYTGKTPDGFRDYVHAIAGELDFAPDRLILGGDHLGPSPWRAEPSADAMAAARIMVADYVRAGFTKIHLDASQACADDREPLGDEVIARRAAELCAAAESVADPAALPMYVIGTEVPVPGGAHEELSELVPTRVEDLERTLEAQRRAFLAAGLDGAWRRVIAVVVQPGVEFDHSSVIEYRRERAQALSHAILDHEGLVYEAHSTDYQTETALRDLVRDHFAILKVGPALTYAAREALFALSHIEQEWIHDRPLSNLRGVLERWMLESKAHWERYYSGSEAERAFARKYSFSDRSRYYWGESRVDESVQALFRNLSEHPPPVTVVSQFMPGEYKAIRAGKLANEPRALVRHRIGEVIAEYAHACGLAPRT